MGTTPDLTPLVLERDGHKLRFSFQPVEEILPELPADYEALLRAGLREALAASGPLEAIVELGNMPALSSRQLGSLIALQKVLRSRIGKLPVHGASDSVTHLLAMTRVSDLFTLV